MLRLVAFGLAAGLLMAAAPAKPVGHPDDEMGQPCGKTALGRLAPAPRKDPSVLFGPTRHVLLCGADGRVAAAYADVGLGCPHASEMLAVRPRTTHGSAGLPPDGTWVSASETQLRVQVYTCHSCRRPRGWCFVGDPSRMSDEQLQDLQQQLGVEPQPLLRKPSQWRTALNPPPKAP